MKTFKYFIYCLAGLLFSFCITIQTSAQESFPGLDNTIPPSPNATTLVRGADVPVSYYTGRPSVQIPVWEMKGRKLTVPISLSYQGGGVKVAEIPGWVGLGWSLNAGGLISRTVRGKADDLQGGYFYDHAQGMPELFNRPDTFGLWKIPGTETEQLDFLKNVANGELDTEPDVFFFNFNGRTGKFFFNVNREVILLSKENLLIRPILNASGKIDSWDVTDEQGNVYQFGTSSATEFTTPGSLYNDPGTAYASTWYLKTITAVNQTDLFQFDYIPYIQTPRQPMPQKKVTNIPFEGETGQVSVSHVEGKYLRRISYPAGIVEFDTANYGSYKGGAITALTRIAIRLKSGELAKAFRFYYGFFPSIGCGDPQDLLPPCKRLRLEKILEMSGNGKAGKPPFMFFYDPEPLPPRGSFSVDYWGYYNGAPNASLIPSVKIRNYTNEKQLPPVFDQQGAAGFDKLCNINLNWPYLREYIWKIPGANREPDPEKAEAGSLKKIVYPTGGSTLFEYEPNDFGYYSAPHRPLELHIEAVVREDQTPPRENINTVFIPFSQEIRLIPLFYIIKGSTKDIHNLDPSGNSGIYIYGPLGMDQQADTILNYWFKDHDSNAGGWEAELRTWLPAGKYIVGVKAAEKDDITRLILKYLKHSNRDTTFKIFSQKFEKATSKAGTFYISDNDSYYDADTFEISELDEPLMEISYYFHSKIHPNLVSGIGLPYPWTKIQISNIDDSTDVLYEHNYSGSPAPIWDEDQQEWFMTGRESIMMSPGRYKVEFVPRISTEYGTVQCTWEKSKAVMNSKIAGGLRIRQITNIDKASDTIGITRFSYQVNDNGTLRSSGVLSGFPLLYELPGELYYTGEINNGTMNYLPLILYSNGKNAPGTLSGAPVGYKCVTASKPGNGKTVFQYSTAIDYPDMSSVVFPYPPAVSYDWKRGLLTNRRTYADNGILVQNEINEYNEITDTTNRVLIPAMKVIHKNPGEQEVNVFQKYFIDCGWNHPRSKTLRSYDSEGGGPVTQEEKYQYSSVHLQMVRKETLNSDSTSRISTFLYPQDAAADTIPLVDTLRNRHILNALLMTEAFNDSIRVSGQKTNYDIYPGNKILPSSVDIWEGTSYQKKFFYDKYDSFGNLLQYHKKGDIFHALNWDEQKLFVTAEVMNASWHELANDYPSVAVVKTYTNHPFWGITSETGPDKVTLFFEYDPFGRLAIVKNSDREIIKSYRYHLKAYLGDTTRPGNQAGTLTYSWPPDRIEAEQDTVTFACGTVLHVVGGALGTGAQWKWYEGMCGGVPVGEGLSVTVTPGLSTEYFVRAEGRLNKTMCARKQITVIPSSLKFTPDSLFFTEEGTPDSPVKIPVQYKGCDAWQGMTDTPWLSVELPAPTYCNVFCERNTTSEARTGIIHFLADGLDTTCFVIQEPFLPLQLTLSASPPAPGTGETLTVTARVENGKPPFNFIWEVKEGEIWNVVRNVSGIYSDEDQYITTAGTHDLTIKCTVNTANKTTSGELLVRISY